MNTRDIVANSVSLEELEKYSEKKYEKRYREIREKGR